MGVVGGIAVAVRMADAGEKVGVPVAEPEGWPGRTGVGVGRRCDSGVGVAGRAVGAGVGVRSLGPRAPSSICPPHATASAAANAAMPTADFLRSGLFNKTLSIPPEIALSNETED